MTADIGTQFNLAGTPFAGNVDHSTFIDARDYAKAQTGMALLKVYPEDPVHYHVYSDPVDPSLSSVGTRNRRIIL
jgi:hypothetical protein